MFCCCASLVYVATFVAIVRLWMKWVIAWNKSYTNLAGKTALVTGANSGIGYYTALDFAKRGARVILACRNKTKAEEAQKKIITLTKNADVAVKIVDFASLDSVRELAKDLNATEKRLDILVNNAGAIGLDTTETKDGNNLYMQTNHFGPFLLTILLIDLLKKSGSSRIVNVSSAFASLGKVDPSNLNDSKDPNSIYPRNKLCNVLFTNELARRLEKTEVKVNSVHPGIVYTNINNRFPTPLRLVFNFIAGFCRTAEEGAQTVIFAAVSNEVSSISGEYFDNCRIGWFPPMPKCARDEWLTKKVWEKSEECVKLTASERLV